MSSDRRVLARRGEQAARRYFKRLGFRIVARNLTCPMGELDLVVFRDGVLRFVEVKTRRGLEACPEDAVNAVKQRRIARMAERFVAVRRLAHLPCQFDVLTVNVDDFGRLHLQHYADAF